MEDEDEGGVRVSLKHLVAGRKNKQPASGLKGVGVLACVRRPRCLFLIFDFFGEKLRLPTPSVAKHNGG